MKIDIVYATEHMSEHYRDFYDGYRALRLVDDTGELRGELVWRVASGHNVEITEFGIFQGEDHRKGDGTQLLDAAIEDMRAYLEKIKQPRWRIHLFCEADNDGGRAFYEARGFQMGAEVPQFYTDGDAAMYWRELE